jgi:cephalosporin-C deacetylase-like acetyl esterase
MKLKFLAITAKVDAYRVRMRSYGGVRVNGWLTIPKGKGPWPGLVSVAAHRDEWLKP